MDTIFANGGILIGAGVEGETDKTDIEGLEGRVALQIDDLLQTWRSTNRHVEIEQDRLLTDIVVQGDHAAISCR